MNKALYRYAQDLKAIRAGKLNRDRYWKSRNDVYTYLIGRYGTEAVLRHRFWIVAILNRVEEQARLGEFL
jgi:hypothetical protein